MQGKSKRYSRHLYDIYKLTAKIDVANVIKNLYNLLTGVSYDETRTEQVLFPEAEKSC